MSITLDGTNGITTPDIASTTSTLGALTQALDLGSTGQIVFPATQNASSNANTLDDYEEGTFSLTVNPTSGYTIAAQNCRYTKIGNLVTINFRVNFSAVSGSNNSDCLFNGLPFNALAIVANVGQVGVARDDSTSGAIYVLRTGSDSATLEINSMDGVVSSNTRTLRTGENYTGTLTYVA